MKAIKTAKKSNVRIFLLCVVVALDVLGFTACNSGNLATYKDAKASEIQAYADAKGQDNYCPNGWKAICQLVTVGKQEVEDALNKQQVDTAVQKAKTSIDRIKNDAEIAEISSIHFYTSKSMVLLERHQLYDFTTKTYSTKTIEEYEGWDGIGEDYSVKATLSDESIAAFLLNSKEQGLFSLKETYLFEDNTSVNNSWNLVIEFKDGTTFISSGVYYPDEASEIDLIFMELSGYKLFGI